MEENAIYPLSGINGENKDSIIEIDEDGLKKYLNVEIGRKLFQVKKSCVFLVNRRIFQIVVSITELNIPAHLIILLMLVCIFSRDGILMESQVILFFQI